MCLKGPEKQIGLQYGNTQHTPCTLTCILASRLTRVECGRNLAKPHDHSFQWNPIHVLLLTDNYYVEIPLHQV